MHWKITTRQLSGVCYAAWADPKRRDIRAYNGLASAHGFQLKESKCKELRISFSTYTTTFSSQLLSMVKILRLYLPGNCWALLFLKTSNGKRTYRVFVKRSHNASTFLGSWNALKYHPMTSSCCTSPVFSRSLSMHVKYSMTPCRTTKTRWTRKTSHACFRNHEHFDFVWPKTIFDRRFI